MVLRPPRLEDLHHLFPLSPVPTDQCPPQKQEQIKPSGTQLLKAKLLVTQETTGICKHGGLLSLLLILLIFQVRGFSATLPTYCLLLPGCLEPQPEPRWVSSASLRAAVRRGAEARQGPGPGAAVPPFQGSAGSVRTWKRAG